MMSEQEDKMFKEVDSLFKKAVEDKHILSTILMGAWRSSGTRPWRRRLLVSR